VGSLHKNSGDGQPAERFDFPNANGQKLAALLDTPIGTPRAYALFAHCFNGFARRPWLRHEG